MGAGLTEAKEARDLIKEEGVSVAFSRDANSPADFDPVTGETPAEDAVDPLTWNADAVILPATLARFRGIDSKLSEDSNLVLTRARYLLCSAYDAATGTNLPEPQPEDRVVFESATWKVAGCSPLKPAGTAVLYKVAVMLA